MPKVRFDALEAGGRGTWFVAPAGADVLPEAFDGLGTAVRLVAFGDGMAAAEGGRVAMAAVFAARGIVFADAWSVAGSTLPPAALAGMALLAEKSAGFEVAAIGGLPPLFFASNCLLRLATVSCCVCCWVG